MTTTTASDRLRAIVIPARRARGVRTIAVAPHLVIAAARAHDDSLLVDADDAAIAEAIEATEDHAVKRDVDGVARIDAPFASTLALAHRWIASASPALVSIPSRDTLLFTSAATERAVRALGDRAERAFHVGRDPISPAIYEARDDRTLAPFHAHGALTNATALGHALLAMTEYEAQRATMTARPNDSVWVAECRLVLREGDDRPLTVATWSERATTLLPIVDIVVLAGGDVRGDGWQFAIRWDDLEARVGRGCFAVAMERHAIELASGQRIVEAPLVPPRLRTIAWPDTPTLLALYAARDSLLTRTASPPR